MPQATQPPPPANTDNTAGEIVKGVFQAVCLTIDVFLHHTIGSNYVACGFAGVIFLWLTVALFPPTEQFPLECFTGIYAVLWLIALVGSWMRQLRGRDNLHSHYTGSSYLRRFWPGLREEYFKQLEALLAVLVALAVHFFARGLGDYLFVATASVFIRGLVVLGRERHRVRMMKDMMYEQKVLSERFKGMR